MFPIEAVKLKTHAAESETRNCLYEEISRLTIAIASDAACRDFNAESMKKSVLSSHAQTQFCIASWRIAIATNRTRNASHRNRNEFDFPSRRLTHLQTPILALLSFLSVNHLIMKTLLALRFCGHWDWPQTRLCGRQFSPNSESIKCMFWLLVAFVRSATCAFFHPHSQLLKSSKLKYHYPSKAP